MVNYRRARIPGASYFFTVTLHPRRAKQGPLPAQPASLALGYSPLTLALRDRRSCLLTEHVDALREAIRAVKRQSPFRIDAVVVLTDHLHTLWTLPEGDENYSGRWRAYFASTADLAALKVVFSVLAGIVSAYCAGTRYGIAMDPADGLLRAGTAGVQITWMDAKIGDWVVTPRIGKPVEIYALWYNALMIET